MKKNIFSTSKLWTLECQTYIQYAMHIEPRLIDSNVFKRKSEPYQLIKRQMIPSYRNQPIKVICRLETYIGNKLG